MNNYRGINLVSICAKVYNKILLNGIQIFIHPVVRRNQAGCISGRSCAQQICTLRRITEGLQAKQLLLVAKFFWKKAFDFSNQESMFAILRHYVILLRSLVQLDSWVTVPNTPVLVDGRMSESFEVTTGVLKGGVLAPFLLIVVLICAMC